MVEQALYFYIDEKDKPILSAVCRHWRKTFKHALPLRRVCDRINYAKAWSGPAGIADEWERATCESEKWVDHRYRRYWQRGKRFPIFTQNVEAIITAGN